MEIPENGESWDTENSLEMARIIQEKIFSIETIEKKKDYAEKELSVLNMVIAREIGRTALIVDRILGPPQDPAHISDGPEEYSEVIGTLRGFEALATDKLEFGEEVYVFFAAEQASDDINNPFFYGKRIFRAPVYDYPSYTILDEAS